MNITELLMNIKDTIDRLELLTLNTDKIVKVEITDIYNKFVYEFDGVTLECIYTLERVYYTYEGRVYCRKY